MVFLNDFLEQAVKFVENLCPCIEVASWPKPFGYGGETRGELVVGAGEDLSDERGDFRWLEIEMHDEKGGEFI